MTQVPQPPSYLWLLPKVANFPGKYRFSVGTRLTDNGLDLLTTLVEAAYSHHKDALLQRANQKVNSTRYLLRLAKDLEALSMDSYVYASPR